jgi:hypothetical protein
MTMMTSLGMNDVNFKRPFPVLHWNFACDSAILNDIEIGIGPPGCISICLQRNNSISFPSHGVSGFEPNSLQRFDNFMQPMSRIDLGKAISANILSQTVDLLDMLIHIVV